METGFVVYCYTVPLELGLPGRTALEPMTALAFLRSAQPWLSEESGSSEPVWGDISPGVPPGLDAEMKSSMKGALGVKAVEEKRGITTWPRHSVPDQFSALSEVGAGRLSVMGYGGHKKQASRARPLVLAAALLLWKHHWPELPTAEIKTLMKGTCVI